jgi:hypothetical protein
MLYRKNATLNEFSTLNMKILQHKQGSQLRNNRRQAPFLKAFGGNWKQEYFSTEHNVVSAKTHYYYLIDLNQINCLFYYYQSYLTMVRSRKPLREQYKPYLCKFMAFKDAFDGVYPTTMEFPQEQLLSIRPHEVASWFKKLAYGTTTPGPDDRPTECRASNLAFCKKALSYFMPNKQHWIVGANVGNPTKSDPVNQVIFDVRKAEVRKQGRASNAKRDMKKPEFRKTLQLLKDSHGLPGVDHFDLASKFTAMMKLQFHIIGRTDDVTNIKQGT